MRCHICNKDMHDNEVKQDPDREQGKFLPCSDCLTEIEETLSTYPSSTTREDIEYLLWLEGGRDDLS